MFHKKNVLLMTLAFLVGLFWNATLFDTDFLADPMPAFYMGNDVDNQAFVFDVHKYGVEHIPYADLRMDGGNAWFYDAIFRLNRSSLMATQFEKTKNGKCT